MNASAAAKDSSTDATAANPLLDLERLTGAEAGIDLDLASTLTLAATGYWNRIRGAIGNVTLSTAPGGGANRQRFKLDAITAKGAEIDLRWGSGSWRAFWSSSNCLSA